MKSKLFFLTFCFSVFHLCCFAAVYTSAGSGSWNTSTTWSPSGIPGLSDDATILSGHNVTTSSSPVSQILNLTINSGGTITIGSSLSLIVKRTLTNDGNVAGGGNMRFTRSDGGIVISGDGTWSHTGHITFFNSASTSQTIDANVVISKSSGNIYLANQSVTTLVTNNGSVTLSGGRIILVSSTNPAKWTQGAASALSINSALPTAATFTLEASAANNTVIYTGINYAIKQPSLNQYYNLTITAGTKTFDFNLTVTNITVNAGATLNRSAVIDVTISGNLTANGTFMGNPSGGTITFNGTSPQTIGGAASTQPFPNLTINSTSTVTLLRNVRVNNNLTVSNGTYILGSFTSNRGSAGGTLTVSNGATLKIGGTNTFPSNYTTNTLGASSTVEYNGSGAQIVGAKNYGNLTINNASGVSSSGAVSVAGATTALTAGVYTVNSSLTYNGGAAQTISGAGSITCSSTGTVTISNAAGVTTSSAMTVAGVIRAITGTFATGATAITVTSIAGNTGRIGDCTGGDITGTAWVMRRFIAAADTGWQDISSPATAAPISQWDASLTMSIASECPDGLAGGWQSVYYWNVATQAWVAVSDCEEPLTPAKGFEMWLATTSTNFVSTTISTTGTPTVGTKTVTIGNAATEVALLGNPYQSPLDWTAMHDNDNTNVLDYFSIFDETTHTYESWDCTTGPCSATGGKLASSGGAIPPYQGFWVENLTAGSTFTFKENRKIASTFELGKQQEETNLLRMTIRSNVMPNAHHSMIRFKEGASEKNDGFGDISFRPSRDKKSPSLVSVSSDNHKLSVSTYPVDIAALDIPLVASVGVPGDYFIDFKGMDNILEYNCIYLEDKETGTSTLLNSDHTYSFSQADISKEHRFTLHLKNSCNEEASPFANTVRVFSVQEGLALNFNFEESTNAQISVYNLLGENVVNQTIRTEKEVVTIPLSKANQIYIVKVTTSEGASAYKVFH